MTVDINYCIKIATKTAKNIADIAHVIRFINAIITLIFFNAATYIYGFMEK